jgi:transposase-like protein
MSKQRRRFDAEFKLETVLEGFRGEKPNAQLYRERAIKDSLSYKWREQFEQRANTIFDEFTEATTIQSRQRMSCLGHGDGTGADVLAVLWLPAHDGPIAA